MTVNDLAACSHIAPLGNDTYTDPRHFAAERDGLFTRNWIAIGFGKDIPDPGDVMPVMLMGLPLVMVRDTGGEVRVFHNVCSHRGMVLVDTAERGRASLRCRYHSWAYGLDGSLRATPEVGGPGRNRHPAIDRSCLGLKQVRSAVWFDAVMVDLSGRAPALAARMEDADRRWAAFRGAALHHGGPESTLDFDVACNWKLAVENFCEAYHLPWVHPGLNSYSRLEDHYTVRDEGGGFSGQGSEVYAPDLGAPDPGGAEAFADVAGLPERWRRRAEYLALYPNLLAGVHRDHVFLVLLLPVAANRTAERMEIYYFDAAMCGPDYAALRRRHAAQWREVFAEDVDPVESMQAGRASPAFAGGVFSPAQEGATIDFHAWVGARIRCAT